MIDVKNDLSMKIKISNFLIKVNYVMLLLLTILLVFTSQMYAVIFYILIFIILCYSINNKIIVSIDNILYDYSDILN
mgnify:CR=1 FL=1